MNGKKILFLIKAKGRVLQCIYDRFTSSLLLRGECIEMKLTDIFHSINDFTIQLKNGQQASLEYFAFEFLCFVQFFVSFFFSPETVSVLPIPSPSTVVIRVLTAFIVISSHLVPFYCMRVHEYITHKGISNFLFGLLSVECLQKSGDCSRKKSTVSNVERYSR